MKILIASILFFIVQALVWFQAYGIIKIAWIKEHWWAPYAVAIPITYIFIKATEMAYDGLGEAWAVRFLNFSIGIIIFTGLTSHFYNEQINLKVIVSLLLAVVIICVQIFWK